jgi:hypothetical protein
MCAPQGMEDDRVEHTARHKEHVRAPVPLQRVRRPLHEHIGDHADVVRLAVYDEAGYVLVEGGLQGLEGLEELDERLEREGVGGLTAVQ